MTTMQIKPLNTYVLNGKIVVRVHFDTVFSDYTQTMRYILRNRKQN